MTFEEKMAQRERTEGYRNRQAAHEKSGGPYKMAHQMSRDEYAKINPMFERMKHI